ncbi:replication factor A [Halobacteriales archaeon QH_10_67_13]|nr:MAG: replication factor A [Halobacteriales archaeon QH_10_67_13]
MSLQDHAEELASDLGVDTAEVRSELETLDKYDVPIDEAKQTVRRRYGDDGDDGAVPSKDLAAITAEDGSVSTTAVVLTAGKRSIQYGGDTHVIQEGELADETGRISYTDWEGFDLDPGATVQIGNANTREWDGAPELNLGEGTTVEPAEESLSVPYEPGGEAALADLEPGDRGVTVEVRVLEAESRTIDGRDGETEITSGVVGDETARLPFTDWEPRPELREGSVRIENAYVREFRGVPSVNASEFSTVTPLDRTVEVSGSAERRLIRAAVEAGGLFDVELVGSVVAVRDGSGLIERCPECGRVIDGGQCRSHGAVEGEDDLRVKAILDDGTGTVTAILDAELTADIYGGGLEAAREHARDAMDRSVVAEEIRDRIVGREFRVQGSLTVDEYGANLTATSFAERTDDPAVRARELLEVTE